MLSRVITPPVSLSDAVDKAMERATLSGHRQRVKVCRCAVYHEERSTHFVITTVDYDPGRFT